MSQNPLGKMVLPPKGYDPGVLFAIQRPAAPCHVYGYERWRCYEFSWLNPRGLPRVGVLEFICPVPSLNIVESKSLKLYLVGIANTRFDSQSQVKETIRRDLMDIMRPEWFVLDILCSSDLGVNHAFGQCIDDTDIQCSRYTRDPSLLKTQLKTHRKETREILYSDLLKTLCPITGQPDWATLVIDYCGEQIDHDALLRYIVSYRNQEGFAEDIGNRIFCDILEKCRASRLTTGLYFTRRGGIDISAVRSSHPIEACSAWAIRPFRQ